LADHYLMLHNLSVIFCAVILPMILVAMALLSWQIGNRGTAILAIATIPFLFLCWGLSHLLAGRERRDIYRHMSGDERDELSRMSAFFGLKVGVFCVLPITAASMATYQMFGQSWIAGAIAFTISLVMLMPIAYRMAKPIHQFFFETEYGKAHFGSSRASQQRTEPQSPASMPDRLAP